MRRFLFLLFVTIATVSLLLVSCHTETPTGIDFQKPTGQINYVYTENDTLVYYDSDSLSFYSITSDSTGSDTTAFEDYTVSLNLLDYSFQVLAEDNERIYEIRVVAIDTVDAESYIIKSVKYPANEVVDITINYTDLKIIPNFSHKTFEIYCEIQDESDNVISTPKLGFTILRGSPLQFFFDEIGLLTEVDGAIIDFRDKIGKMNIIQFHSKG